LGDNKWYVNLVWSVLERWRLENQSRWNDNINMDLGEKVGERFECNSFIMVQ
jgi:hypothetical protein